MIHSEPILLNLPEKNNKKRKKRKKGEKIKKKKKKEKNYLKYIVSVGVWQKHVHKNYVWASKRYTCRHVRTEWRRCTHSLKCIYKMSSNTSIGTPRRFLSKTDGNGRVVLITKTYLNNIWNDKLIKENKPMLSC